MLSTLLCCAVYTNVYFFVGKANETGKHQALQPKCAAVVASSPMRKISALSNADMKALGNEVNNAARNANNT